MLESDGPALTPRVPVAAAARGHQISVEDGAVAGAGGDGRVVRPHDPALVVRRCRHDEMARARVPHDARGPGVAQPPVEGARVRGQQSPARPHRLHAVALVVVHAARAVGDGGAEVVGVVGAVGGEAPVVLVPPDEDRPVVVPRTGVAQVGDLGFPRDVARAVEPHHPDAATGAGGPAAETAAATVVRPAVGRVTREQHHPRRLRRRRRPEIHPGRPKGVPTRWSSRSSSATCTRASVPSQAGREPPDGIAAMTVGNGSVSPSPPCEATEEPTSTSVTTTSGAVQLPTVREQAPPAAPPIGTLPQVASPPVCALPVCTPPVCAPPSWAPPSPATPPVTTPPVSAPPDSAAPPIAARPIIVVPPVVAPPVTIPPVLAVPPVVAPPVAIPPVPGAPPFATLPPAAPAVAKPPAPTTPPVAAPPAAAPPVPGMAPLAAPLESPAPPTQIPATQDCPVGQATPQAPQWLLSVAVTTQRPSQDCCPGGSSPRPRRCPRSHLSPRIPAPGPRG